MSEDLMPLNRVKLGVDTALGAVKELSSAVRAAGFTDSGETSQLPEDHLPKLQTSLNLALYRLDTLLNSDLVWQPILFGNHPKPPEPTPPTSYFRLLNPEGSFDKDSMRFVFAYRPSEGGCTIVGTGATVADAIENFELACRTPAQRLPEPDSPPPAGADPEAAA